MNTSGGTRRIRTMAVLAILAAFALTGCNDFFTAGWGNNQYAQLGDGSTINSSTPADVNTDTALFNKVVTTVDAGLWDACATTLDGTGACWGARRPIPLDPTAFDLYPVPNPTNGVLTGKTVTKTAAGTTERCALTSDGTVGCWRPDTPVPFALGGLLDVDQVVQLEIRSNYKCVLTADNVLACGGLMGEGVLNASGVLAGKTIVQLTKSGQSNCALTADNLVACWGNNSKGQLGNGTTDNHYWDPVAVDQNGAMAGKTIVSLANGLGQHMCAVASDGSAYCWGYNNFGQLGTGNTTDSAVPVQVVAAGALSGKGVGQMSFGASHTCAILTDESMACWGLNSSGQLGNGTNTNSLVPVAVQPKPASDGQPRPIITSASGLEFNHAVYQEQVPSQFIPMQPRRVVDTRQGGVPIGPNGQLMFTLAGVVPEGTTAVAYNLTATGQTASGAAALMPYSSVVTAEQTSVINWSAPRQTIANGFLTKVPSNRQLEIKLNSTGSSDFVVDITGYFVPAGDPNGTLYNPAEARIYDSRDGDGPLGPGQSRVINVLGPGAAGGGQAGAIASWPMQAMNGSTTAGAAVNVTVTGTVGSGVMTVAKTTSTTTSTVNWTGPAQTVANAVITDVAPDGTFTVTNNGGTPADVVVDLTGTFLPADLGSGASFFPAEPGRVYDSRGTNGALPAGQSRGTTLPVPTDAVAVALNTTITGTSGTGYLAVTPPATGVPQTSMVNWFASPTTRANGAIVPVARTANRAYTGGSFATQYLYDTAGFFR